MKKVTIIVILSIFASMLLAMEYSLESRIDRYSGKNAEGLKQLLQTTSPDTLRYIHYILDNASSFDLAVLTPDFIMMNIRLSMKTKELPYTKNIPEDIFTHFVLLPRISQEPFVEWRPRFYQELYPVIKDCKTLEEAAFLVNLWSEEQMTFKPTNGRDQTPLTTIKRGYGRCEEMMILYMAAARSVGIPCRPASAPYWNFTDNNHAWTDVWTTSGWKFIGSAEAANRLGETWFADTTNRATLVLSESYGDLNNPQKVKFENGVSTLATTGDYTTTVNVTLKIEDEKGRMLPDAQVMIYGATYGGEMPMLSLKSDKNGIVRFPLGKGGVWVTAYGDSLFGNSLLDTMNGDATLTITCRKNTEINERFNIHFPLPSSRPSNFYGQPIISDFDHLRDLSNLKREKRLNSYKHTLDFLDYYDVHPNLDETDSSFTARRDSYLQKCDQLAGNADLFLKLFKVNVEMDHPEARRDLLCKMIEDWDVKELVELPDSEAVQTILDLYLPSKLAYPDSIWRQNILDYTFSTPPCPEDGWQKNLYELIKDQQALDNETTVSNLLKWIDDHVTIDKDIVYTYFSGSIDPLDYLNMHNIPASGRTILLASSLKLLQVPIRWKGYLEYYSEGKFIPVEEQKDKKNKPDFKQRDITVSVTIDGNKVKASPYENFLLAEMGDKGTIDDTYFDNKDQKLDCVLTFPQDKDVDYYLEGMTRNDNGDAQILIQSVKAGKDKYKIDLNTPKNYFDATANWSSKTRKDIVQYARKWGTGDGCKLIFIRASETSEPQQRMLDEILGKTRDFQAKNCDIIVYTENRSNDDIKNTQGIQLKSGLPVLTDKLNLMSYPAVFLVSPDQQILFSSRGYQMGMGSLLLKKIK